MSSLVKSECPESAGLQETTAVATHSAMPDTFSPPPSQPQIVDTPDPGLGQPLSDDLSLAPLSFAQQRLWFLDQLNPRSALYNIPMALRMFGELSVTALQQAIAAVVDRHHVLRTRIRCIEGEPWQDTCDPSPVEIPLIDFSTLPEDSKESELQRQLSSEARTAFHLSGDLLFRAKLFRMGAAQHVLFVNMHHVASDAFSFVIFFREVSGVYGAILAGRSTALPDLPIQYADYAAWQRETVNQAGRWINSPIGSGN